MTIALVTGGGSGIGAEVCRALAAPGQHTSQCIHVDGGITL